MAKDIAKRISNLKIMAEEGSIIALDDVTGDESGKNFNLALVGKVLTIIS